MPSLKCFSCGSDVGFIDKLQRRDECLKCRADARVCKNCDFYDPKVYNECRETSADPVQEKERSNLCDFFRPKTGGGLHSQKTRADELREQAEALFRKKD